MKGGTNAEETEEARKLEGDTAEKADKAAKSPRGLSNTKGKGS
jgi:hypothetical protein